MAQGALAYADVRATPRDEVHYRAKGFGPDARPLSLLIVNLSAQGLMARHDGAMAVGARLRINLPVVGTVAAEVRWALGGRIGCELDAAIPQPEYYELLSVIVRGR